MKAKKRFRWLSFGLGAVGAAIIICANWPVGLGLILIAIGRIVEESEP